MGRRAYKAKKWRWFMEAVRSCEAEGLPLSPDFILEALGRRARYFTRREIGNMLGIYKRKGKGTLEA